MQASNLPLTTIIRTYHTGGIDAVQASWPPPCPAWVADIQLELHTDPTNNDVYVIVCPDTSIGVVVYCDDEQYLGSTIASADEDFSVVIQRAATGRRDGSRQD